MNFLGTPDIGPLLFFGLTAASFVTAFVGVFTGTAGGVVLLALMAMVMPPAVLVPIHTVVQLGSGISRTIIMWRYVMRSTLLPFVIGSIIGAALGAKTFVALPTNWLLAIIGTFILVVTWMPSLGRIGAEKGRFGVLGFLATFMGVFVSATGTFISPFIASAAPDRRNHVATQGALMISVHVAKLMAFSFIGFTIGAYLPLMAAMIATGSVGNWLGEKALERTQEKRFRTILKLVLTLLACQLLFRAISEAGWW
ncbi:MAG: sulfite exporter TauE/SafE family protein [Beijerinckiaceae bacterium]|nr:sulfite exporter TauE/SafE family protein [Beijerinckiaceae bacterium]MDO9440246.1 sulfite exporter TauE/SafE family protein [Beijerinckiaceae bacterium]